MPLSEFQSAMIKGKPESTQSKMANCSSDLSFMPDEFAELLWDNGPVVMQGHSNKPRKSSFPSFFSSHDGRVQEKNSKDAAFPKIAHFGSIESKTNNVSNLGPYSDTGLNAQDHDTVPWIHYPIEDSHPIEETLQNDFYSEFLNEFSQSSLSAQSNTLPVAKSASLGQVVRESHNMEEGHASEPSRIRTSHLFQSPQQCQSLVPSTKSRDTHQDPCGNLMNSRFQKLDPVISKPMQPSIGTNVMNFSHFSRPVALARANLQSTDRLRSNEKASTVASSNPMEFTVIESTSGLKSVSGAQDQLASVPANTELRSLEAACQEDISRKNNNQYTSNNCTRAPDGIQSQSFGASVTLGRNESQKGHEAVIASSSVCSGSSAGAASPDPKHGEKRKHREGEESGYQSEDLEDDSVGLKKAVATMKGTSAKRSRAAEVHNLSERRRRDRINEKMRALQELIPNSNKTDKASMLDEAIEYLKTLQLQLQMMSMGSGLYMPPMMMQHMRAPTVAHYSPMGIGMGMGYGMGVYDINGPPACPLIPVPPIHGPQFAPCPSIPGILGLHRMPGSANLQTFGIHGPGFHPPMPHQPPSSSLPGSVKANSVPESGRTPSPAPASGSQDQQQQDLNLGRVQKSSFNDLQIQISTQASKECLEDSALVQMNDQPSLSSH